MKKAVEAGMLLALGLAVMSALIMARAAMGETFNVLLTDEKTWTCELPTTREPLGPGLEGIAIAPDELASVQYYMGAAVDDTMAPFKEKTLTQDDKTCEVLVQFADMPLGDHVIWARVTDTEGRQSKPSEPVPFGLVRDPGLPLAPTGGHFVDTPTPAP